MKKFSDMEGYKEFMESDNEYCTVYEGVIAFGEKIDCRGQLFSYNQVKDK
jgi:hypothetical protein